MTAASFGHVALMKIAHLALASVLALPFAARAEPPQEAGSAMGACLAAVIDKAPVSDVKGQDVEIRREPETGACTVRVNGGETVAVRKAVLGAMSARRERFTPAKTAWAPGAFASRETFCNAALVRRNLNVLVSTALPTARGPRLIASVVETKARDGRCDTDQGLQRDETR
ncbi:hypothetical protein [Phenylobacterium deserti]|uniref:Uncharacterized protein n=1 Tax=Phenylobacterium deserti TaxID=1914756 RepID=A0A328A8A4_9CAUL|nr:hypothetical protein [Phenylobacterium deserti]RAK50689.1 hypothetical protein DJ018_18225 [Phenylobacterium deserti]